MSERPSFNRDYFQGRGSNYILGYGRLRRRFLWRRRLKLAQRFLPAGGKLLDVGCAFGFFLEQMDGRCEKYGVDVSEYAIARARRLLRSKAWICRADVEQGIPFSGPFELITAFDIAEHLPNPPAAFRHLAQILKPGGRLLLELPTRAPWIDRDASHLYQPIGRWVSLLEEAGFRILRVRGYWTIGFRIILIPSGRGANYHQIIAQR